MKYTKEIKVGFLAIVGIMMSVFSYNYLKGINLLKKTETLKLTILKLMVYQCQTR